MCFKGTTQCSCVTRLGAKCYELWNLGHFLLLSVGWMCMYVEENICNGLVGTVVTRRIRFRGSS